MTIEQKSQIAPEFRTAIGNRIFGCDDCLAVCPWNKFAQVSATIKLQPKHDPALYPLSELLMLDEAGFRSKFASMPVRRAGFERFMRNVLIAVGNSGDASLAPLVRPYLDSEMGLVRGMAIWALSRLISRDDLHALYQPSSNQEIEAEWKRALAKQEPS